MMSPKVEHQRHGLAKEAPHTDMKNTLLEKDENSIHKPQVSKSEARTPKREHDGENRAAITINTIQTADTNSPKSTPQSRRQPSISFLMKREVFETKNDNNRRSGELSPLVASLLESSKRTGSLNSTKDTASPLLAVKNLTPVSEHVSSATLHTESFSSSTGEATSKVYSKPLVANETNDTSTNSARSGAISMPSDASSKESSTAVKVTTAASSPAHSKPKTTPIRIPSIVRGTKLNIIQASPLKAVGEATIADSKSLSVLPASPISQCLKTSESGASATLPADAEISTTDVPSLHDSTKPDVSVTGTESLHDSTKPDVTVTDAQSLHDSTKPDVTVTGTESLHDSTKPDVTVTGTESLHDSTKPDVTVTGTESLHDSTKPDVTVTDAQSLHDSTKPDVTVTGTESLHDSTKPDVTVTGTESLHDSTKPDVSVTDAQSLHDSTKPDVSVTDAQSLHDSTKPDVTVTGTESLHDSTKPDVTVTDAQSLHDSTKPDVSVTDAQSLHDSTKPDVSVTDAQSLHDSTKPDVTVTDAQSLHDSTKPDVTVTGTESLHDSTKPDVTVTGTESLHDSTKPDVSVTDAQSLHDSTKPDIAVTGTGSLQDSTKPVPSAIGPSNDASSRSDDGISHASATPTIQTKNAENATAEPTYEALYDFHAEEHEQLSLHVGDIVHEITGELMDGWMFVRSVSSDRHGYVPKAYLRQKQKSPSSSSENVDQHVMPLLYDTNCHNDSSIQLTGRICKVIYKFEAFEEEQLSVVQGQLLTVEADDPENPGWVLAHTTDNRAGYVPESYLMSLDQPDGVRLSTQNSSNVHINDSNGTSSSNGSPALIDAAINDASSSPVQHREKAGINVDRTSSVASSDKLIGQSNLDKSFNAVAMFDFKSQNPSQMSIKAGQLLQLVPHLDTNDWAICQGELGERGLVPLNHTQKVLATVRSSFNFQPFGPQAQEQLPLTSGCTVYVLSEDEGTGWVSGMSDGRLGLVPVNYINLQK